MADLTSAPTLRVPRLQSLRAATRRVLRPNKPESQNFQDSPAATPHDATLRVGENPPVPLSPTTETVSRLPLGVLANGDVVMGDCTVSQTLRPHETTRPGLYDCNAPEGRVMVKIAAADHPPQLEFWEKLPRLRHPALVKTHRVGRERGFFCEVQEFCEGGTLDDCIPRDGRAALPFHQLERGVIAPFLSGIAYLHQNGVVHRDIKPKNLYLRRVEGKVSLAIGDFDISSAIETGHTSRDTVRAAGTHFYMAPESFPRFVDPEAGRAAAIVSSAGDYYSFGVVLLELLLGTTSLHSGRWSDVYDFYMAGGRLELPENLDSRLRNLLQGLLIRNRKTRWGADECGRWLRLQNTEADLQKIRDDAGFQVGRRASRPFNVFKSNPTDLHSLGEAMIAEPLLAEEELLSGDLLVNWVGEIDAKLAREIRRDREQWRAHPRVALNCVLLRLDPTLPFTFGPGRTISSLAELDSKVSDWAKNGQMDLGLAVNRPSLLGLENWLRLRQNPDLHAAEGVKTLREFWWNNRETSTMTPVDVRLAWEEMRCLLDPTRPFTLASGVKANTPREIARLCYGSQVDWMEGVPSTYRSALERWRDGWLGVWLRQRLRDENGQLSPVVAQIEALRTKDKIRPEATWEAVLRILDPSLPKVKLRLHSPDLGAGFVLEWGETGTARIGYEAISPGLPFGAWGLEDAPLGLKIRPFEIEAVRRGEGVLSLESQNGLQPGSAGRSRIVLEKGGTCTLENPLTVVYRVKLPDAQRVAFIRNGAMIGAGLAGGARLLAFLCTGREWDPVAGQKELDAQNARDFTAAQTQARQTQRNVVIPEQQEEVVPPASYVGAGAALILGFVIAFYLWLDALRRLAYK